jgi:signal transduction histidine kinase
VRTGISTGTRPMTRQMFGRSVNVGWAEGFGKQAGAPHGLRGRQIAGMVVWAGLAVAATVRSDEVPLSSAAALAATPWTETQPRTVVRVRGAVSAVGDGIISEAQNRPARRGFCVEDDSGGIWIAIKFAILEELLPDDRDLFAQIESGVEVEVVGQLAMEAGLRPVILPTQIRVLGPGVLEPPKQAELQSFLSGGDEMRRVMVSGVVQEVTDEARRQDRWVLRIETGIGHFFVRVLKGDRYSPEKLLDARLLVTGLVASSRNWRSEFVSPRVIVGRHEDIRILEPAPVDAFAVESVPLAGLNGYTLTGRPVHRRRVEGTVTYNDGQSLIYLQDDDVGVRVHTSQPSDARVGDRVEVAGFVDASQYLAGLRGAVVRRLEGESAGEPLPVLIASEDVAEYRQRVVLGPRLSFPSMSCEGRLTELTGRVLHFRPATARSPNLLEIGWGDSITTALVAGELPPIPPESMVRVTGIARVSSEAARESVKTARPARVDLLLRSAGDLEVLSRPGWWTPRRILVALAVASGIALGAVAWALVLRRTLRWRTEQLASEVRNRRDAAIDFQAAMRERIRLAVDLHDTVLQTMAGVAFQIDACRSGREADEEQQASHLETAGRMLRNGQEDLRNVVWALRCLPLQDGTLLDSVRAIAGRVKQRHGIEMTVAGRGQLPPLADFVAGNLLLVIQEASHNAVKHAQADRIEVSIGMNFSADRLMVSVRDDGIGFDVKARPRGRDGHFGIEGMRQRIHRIGGVLQIESGPTAGTEIRAEIPVRVFDTAIA